MADRLVGRGDVETLGADGQPMEADQLQAFGDDDVAGFPAPIGRQRRRLVFERERSDLDALPTRFFQGAAGGGEIRFLEEFVADGESESVVVSHGALIVH